jgi:hypothetical protein
MRKLAIDPRAWTRECLKAIDLLTRVAVGPSNRPLDDMNVAAGREAALIRSRSVKRRRLPVLVERPLKIETPGKNARPVDTVEKFKNEPSHPMPVLIVCLMSFNQKWGTKRCSSQLCERRPHFDRCLLESDLNENRPAHADLARYRSSRVGR